MIILVCWVWEKMLGRLDIQANEEEVITFYIGKEATRIGRAPDNNLVIQNPNISSYHAILLWEEDQLVLHDLGSKNGTQVNGKFVSKPTVLNDETQLLLGQSVSCYLQLLEKPRQVSYAIEVVGTKIIFPLLDRITSVCDGYFVRWDNDRKIVHIFDSKEEKIGTLAIDEQCSLLNCEITLKSMNPLQNITIKKEQEYPYSAHIIEHPSFPIVEISEEREGKKLRFYQTNRAKLLFALVCARKQNDQGWVDDGYLREQIWGKEGHNARTNNFNVLIHRVREDLFSAGFNGHCLEKKKGFSRLLVSVK